MTTNADALPSWERYYERQLGWPEHLSNALHHLPMMDAIRRRRPRSILEVGAGTGSLAIFLSYFGRRVTSIDLSPAVLEGARDNARRLRGRVRFEVADAFTLDQYGDATFDVAISQGFFEHFSDDEIAALLGQQLRVARTAILSVPNAAYGKQDRGDERLMTREEWDAIIRRAGFRIEESRDYRPVCRGTFTGHARRYPPSMYLAVVTL